MNAPAILAGGTGLLAATAVVLRRRPGWSAVVSTTGLILLAAFTLTAPLDEAVKVASFSIKVSGTLNVLGRAFIIGPANRAMIGFLYLAGGFLFGAGWMARPGRTFYPAGLVLLGAVGSALTISPFLYAAIFLEVAVLAAVILLSPPTRPALRGSLRLLVFYTLAMMAILVTGWMLPSIGVTRATPGLVNLALRLLGLGFAVLMLVPPFHVWLLSGTEEASPYALVFVVIILQSTGLFFMLRFIDSYDWLRGSPVILQGLREVGVAVMVIGIVWALVERTQMRAAVYVLIIDMGVTILSVGVGTPPGYQLALGLSGTRVVSLGVWGLGMSVLERDRLETPGRRAWPGAAFVSPLATAAAMVGFVSLGGLPLTAGFPGRWGIIRALLPVSPGQALLVVVAVLACGGVAMRWLRPGIRGAGRRKRLRLTTLERLYLLVGLAMCILLGVFPQLLYPWVVQAASGLSNLVP